MDFGFVGFLGTIVAIGMAIALPIAFLLRVRGASRHQPIEPTESAELRGRLGEYEVQLEDALRRIGDLEERLDFTERLLAQRDAVALPRASDEATRRQDDAV